MLNMTSKFGPLIMIALQRRSLVESHKLNHLQASATSPRAWLHQISARNALVHAAGALSSAPHVLHHVSNQHKSSPEMHEGDMG